MTRRHRILMTLRIIALILVGLAFLIARLAKAREISAAELSSRPNPPEVQDAY
jgi:hypothetical protein